MDGVMIIEFERYRDSGWYIERTPEADQLIYKLFEFDNSMPILVDTFFSIDDAMLFARHKLT